MSEKRQFKIEVVEVGPGSGSRMSFYTQQPPIQWGPRGTSATNLELEH